MKRACYREWGGRQGIRDSMWPTCVNREILIWICMKEKLSFLHTGSQERLGHRVLQTCEDMSTYCLSGRTEVEADKGGTWTRAHQDFLEPLCAAILYSYNFKFEILKQQFYLYIPLISLLLAQSNSPDFLSSLKAVNRYIQTMVSLKGLKFSASHSRASRKLRSYY